LKRSISFRLTCWFSGIFLAGFVAFGVLMYLDLAYQLSIGRDRTLGRRAARCIDLLKATTGGRQMRRAEKFEEFTDATPEGNLILVYSGGGTRLFADPSSPAKFPWPNPKDARDRYDNRWFEGKPYRVLTKRVQIGDEPIIVQVGGQLEDNQLLLSRFQTGLQAATPGLLILSALCGYFVSRRALRPVDRLISGVRSISVHDLSARLLVNPTGDELQRLAETCNEMLARLENAVARINRFTADASHELRSPISFIRNVSEFALQQDTLDGETRQAFEEILVESVEAGNLLEDMLTLARADEGRLTVSLVPLDLRNLLDEVCDKGELLASAKGQTFVRPARLDAPLMVKGDPPTLRRLFWALLDNAVKYTPEAGRIAVDVMRRGTQILVSISDNGVGIPQNMLPRVFERFFRADVSRAHGGTGLGLAIAKWIADAHHAVIVVRSAEGDGTVFEVTFHAVSPGLGLEAAS
jgi:heavy metal sensor kinase